MLTVFAPPTHNKHLTVWAGNDENIHEGTYNPTQIVLLIHTSTVSVTDVRKPPDIAEVDGEPDYRQKKVNLFVPCFPLLLRFRFFYHFCLFIQNRQSCRTGSHFAQNFDRLTNFSDFFVLNNTDLFNSACTGINKCLLSKINFSL